VEGVQVMPRPVAVLGQEEAAGLLRRAATARGIGAESAPREVGGFGLEITGPGEAGQLVWGTFHKQDGLLALFRGGRLLAAVDKGLGEIRRVQPLALPGLPQFAIMVDDRVDEMVGAFARQERRLIYVWDGRTLRQVYQGILEGEQYSHARWENPRGHNVWRLRRTLGEVSIQGGTLTEVTRVQQLEAPGAPDAPLPPDSAFRLVREQRAERRLVWNARLRRFDPGT
jgi:hypothetical protein